MRKPSCQISAKAEWLAYAVGMKKHGGDRDNIIIIKKSTNVKETPPDKCTKCLSLIGPGHDHSLSSCNSNSTILNNLEKQLPPHVSEQFASRIIDKAPKNSAGQSVLSTAGGKPKLVSVGPVSDDSDPIPHEAFFRRCRAR